MLVAVIHTEGQANELRQDSGATAPHLDDFTTTALAYLLSFLEKIAIDERTFPN
ncbi:hypothetical protein D3C81_1996170 [compost metagenome]